MIKKLYDYFTKNIGHKGVLETEDNYLSLDLTSNYGNLKFTINDNKYIVEGTVDEEQYCNIFMIDEDEIDYEDLDAWNTTDSFSNINKALERCQEIVDAYESETGGCDVFNLNNPYIFIDALKVII